MECELAQQKIALFAYGELPDDQCHGLEGHLATCKRCQEEFGAVQALQQAMSLAPILEPSANLLAQARLQLEEALDSMPRAGWLNRVQQSMFRGISTLGRAPVTASVLLILGVGSGLAGGGWYGYKMALRNHPQAAVTLAGPGTIASVTDITRIPHTAIVEVHFTRSVPEIAQGSFDDPQIRNLLLAATQDRVNPSVTQNSVNLLADACVAGQCSDSLIRKALMVSLSYDTSPAVRLKALDGLKSYVGEDVQVRDAVLEAVLDDQEAAVRSRAIELLRPVEGDSSVREVLHTVSTEDDNPHIRTVSREVLDQSTLIQ